MHKFRPNAILTLFSSCRLLYALLKLFLFQFVNVVHPRLIDSLLDDATYLVTK